MTEPMSLEQDTAAILSFQKTIREGILDGRKIKLLTAGCALCAVVGSCLLFGGISLAACAPLVAAYYAVPIALSLIGGIGMVLIGIPCLLFARNLERQALELQKKNAWMDPPSTLPPTEGPIPNHAPPPTAPPMYLLAPEMDPPSYQDSKETS